VILMFLLSRWSGGLIARIGAKLPLVIGPVIAAAGFALFTLPGVGGSYWTTFFPAIVVLGLGMAVSVAPLTTTVMNAVERSHAGIASGINNAVARTAGLLAVALFGLVMSQAFDRHLDRQLAAANVPGDIALEMSDRSKLAAMDIPARATAATRSVLQQAVAGSFAAGFRRVMLISAALALLAALGAWLTISGPARRPSG